MVTALQKSLSPEIWGGIECTINRVQNDYFDQLEYSQHYTRPDDIENIAELGIKKIRYPILWEKHQPERLGEIDWRWIEKQISALNKNNIEIIAGLTHHGSGPAFTNLADPLYPNLLAAYAKQTATKFPSINYYTPVNEPLTTARFSGLYGIWYPHQKDAKVFVEMLLNQVKGIVLSMQEIRKINPHVQLVQTEDLSKTYSTSRLQYQADFENERRWLTYDLLCGRVDRNHSLWNYLDWLKIPAEKFEFFLDNICKPDIFGFNYYVTSERFLDHRVHLYPPQINRGKGKNNYADVEAVRSKFDQGSGLAVLLKEAWDRYQQPMAITEVHLHCHREEQLRWFKHVYNTAADLAAQGINIKAVTAWALLGSYGWSHLLTRGRGLYEPGVFDLRGGVLRATALAPAIKEIQKEHPASNGEGWWKRHNRFFHEPSFRETFKMKKENNQPPIVIIGKKGTLGKAFARICDYRHLPYKLLSREDCDITNMKSVKTMIDAYKPWSIINAAGYVRVDDAEKESEKCFNDNTGGPHNLAKACEHSSIKLVSFSTDLVFDGKKNIPYVESDKANPLNIYGLSKFESEQHVSKANPGALIIRTSAFFGPWDEYNFLHYVRKSLSQFEKITVASDIYISPTYIPDLVHTTLDLTIDDEKGIWHLANEGETTWAGLAMEIAEQFDMDKKFIIALPKDEIFFAAKRPAYTVLKSEKATLLPTLDDALQRYYKESQGVIMLSKTA